MRELTDIDVIRDVLGRHGFHFSKSKGQNFLTASWVPEEIVDRACLDENTGVLEIGPGLGSLTVKLSEAAGKVLAVELDETLMPVLAETLQGCENTEVLFGNILKKDVAQLVEENFQGLRPVVCADLPYNVSCWRAARFSRSPSWCRRKWHSGSVPEPGTRNTAPSASCASGMRNRNCSSMFPPTVSRPGRR